ncbi:helix-turn-helix domain-containing protein [Flavobacterium sp.]|jgi:AraC-like DNA-binding protein|uniref:helix-turn-helix domain-containing protein n=1 Tax=Flavobacterium sp. TaxID=239 RepID=UPI00391BDC69
MKIFKPLLWGLFLCYYVVFGQSSKTASHSYSYDELRNLYYKYESKPKEQSKYALAYLKKAQKENNNDYIARGYVMLAVLEYDHNDEKALVLLDKSIQYSNNKKDFTFPTLPYFEKAILLKKKLLFKEAINNFIMAEKFSSKDDLDYHYYILLNIAVIKSEGLGEVEEAMKLYKKCFQFYKKKDFRDPKYAAIYQEILFDIADAYKSLGKIDSTTIYNKLGYNEAKITKSDQMLQLFILNEGANQVANRQYRIAIDSIDKVIPKIKAYKNYHNLLAAFYYKGKANEGLKNTNEALKWYQKVDSLNNIHNIITPEFIGGYNYIIDFYRKKGDKDKQLKYLIKLTSIDSTLKLNYRELTKKINLEYDFPLLMKEKESIISSLKNENKLSRWSLWLLILLFSSLLIYTIYQYKQKKNYKKKFEELISEKPLQNVNEKSNKEVSETIIPSNEIGQDVVVKILKCLHEFEEKKDYLKPNITIQTLSKDFETNSKYLSKIVNEYKEKSFTQYLNDLRIEFAVISLKNENRLRKYTINALATEFGFNNSESFSISFYKKTGIKPSYFIKELENYNNQKMNAL